MIAHLLPAITILLVVCQQSIDESVRYHKYGGKPLRTYQNTTAKPLASIPQALRELPQWLGWCWVPGADEPKKQPVDLHHGGKGSTTDPTNWMAFEEAVAATHGEDRGLGFVFTAADPFAGVDLDDCRDPETSEIAPWAYEIILGFDSYSEVSPSGTGVHVYLRGALPGTGRRTGKRPEFGGGEIEFYDRGRFFAVTGKHLPETPATVEDRAEQLTALYERLFGPHVTEPVPLALPVPREDNGDDDGLLGAMFAAKNGAVARMLWDGDTSAYGGDDSAADLALCGHLAFYTGPDPARIDRIFRRSRLMRDKWERTDYRDRTIAKALAERTEFWQGGRRGGIVTALAPEWDMPIPFGDQQLPPFPTIALPGWLRDFVEAEAVATQTPTDLSGMLALAALATAGAGRVVVRPRAGWHEPVNLYTTVVLPPASRKSPVFAHMVEPIDRHERDLVAAARLKLSAAKGERKIKEGKLKKAEEEAVRAEEGADYVAALAKVAALTAELAAAESAEPRLVADDVTPEKLAGLLAAQGGRLALLAPEGGVFGMMAGRYANGIPNLGVYLRAHAGEKIRVDRQGRPADYVAAATLTIGVTMQPDVLHSLNDRGELRGQGLLARFLYALPENRIGWRDTDPPPVPEATREAYFAGMLALLALEPGTDVEGQPTPHTLVFDPSAQARWGVLAAEIEARLRPLGILGTMAEWGGKLLGHIARIAGLLHLARHAADPAPWNRPIATETLEGAIAIGDYASEHARAAFGEMGADPALEGARYLLRWIDHRGATSFNERDAYNSNRARFPKASSVAPALALLVEHNYLRPQEIRRKGPGRAPSTVYAVNPHHLADSAPSAPSAALPAETADDDEWGTL